MDQTAPEIFCSLSSVELRDRKADVRESLTPHLIASSYARGVSHLAFARPEVSRVHLEHLIKLEQACCPFFHFEIREMDTEVMLSISGPEGSEDFVRDLFASQRSASCGCCG
ncbi:MAG: hypothetical protein AAFR21_18720 [Pseudomonadota bacterium]